MAPSWQGYETQLLTAAGFPTDAKHVAFIDDWNAHASSNCPRNPVDISHVQAGTTNCHVLTTRRTAQAYPSQRVAIASFNAQMHSGNFLQLVAALKGADPYTYPQPNLVVADLKQWGSLAFADYYLQKTTPVTPARHTTYYLQGGPCDGKTGPITPGLFQPYLVCGGHNYNPTSPPQYRPNGDYIIVDIGPVGGTATPPKAARLHKGYADLRHSLNHVMPAQLSASRRTLGAGLRTVERARKVKI